ncbi:GNAT family protein [Paenibacillus sp. AN1007]|jgi:ribosomal-protein-alanine N-acetyltransferase|uniref:GNAT family protein n=1 Tax=Paenibacillus sp. AN1007 TaxID=3151385 RepID=A0AAU8NGM4_9BACL
MDIVIEKLEEKDFENLYTFEVENRPFFEKFVPSRGDDYYKPEVFKVKNKHLLDEQDQGLSLFYLIKDEHHSIIGRINVVDIHYSNKNRTGSLGYRLAQACTGKGIAARALHLLLQTIVDSDIKEIHAKTTNNNTASQKVLEKNGFEHIETSDHEFEMNGQLLKFMNYKWIKK